MRLAVINKIKHAGLLIIVFLFSTLSLSSFSQNSPYIYEHGVPIVSYESNFKNLLNNWKPQYITNAGLYEFTECSFVETITDSTRYNYYRNYFSGIEPVSKSKRGGYRVDHTGKRSHELYIEPGYAHREFFDQRGLPDEAKKLLTDELKAEAIDILTREINIDTMSLFHYSYEKPKLIP